MKNFILIILLFSFLNIYSQNDKIDHISIEQHGGIYMGPGGRIKISIASTDINNDFMDVYATVDGKQIKTQISLEKYSNICKKLMDLNPKDIIEDAPFYLDSSDTKIRFSVFMNSIEYSVQGLNNGDEKTNRKDFLEIAIILFDIVKAKVPNIN